MKKDCRFFIIQYIVYLLLVMFAGCSSASEQYAGLLPDIPLQYLLAVPETTKVDGRAFSLSTYLWRDFMPTTSPTVRPLLGVVTLTAMDGLAVGNGFSSDAVWIVHQGQIWKSRLSDELNSGKANHLVKRFSDGPAWGPGVSVDVVVRLRGDNNTIYFLRASKQQIGRTD